MRGNVKDVRGGMINSAAMHIDNVVSVPVWNSALLLSRGLAVPRRIDTQDPGILVMIYSPIDPASCRAKRLHLSTNMHTALACSGSKLDSWVFITDTDTCCLLKDSRYGLVHNTNVISFL